MSPTANAAPPFLTIVRAVPPLIASVGVVVAFAAAARNLISIPSAKVLIAVGTFAKVRVSASAVPPATVDLARPSNMFAVDWRQTSLMIEGAQPSAIPLG